MSAFRESLRRLTSGVAALVRLREVLASTPIGRVAKAEPTATPPVASSAVRGPAVLFRKAAAIAKLAPVERQPYDGPGRRLFRPVPVGPYCCATYVSIEKSCAESCPFKRDANGGPGGCFANEGFTRFAVKRLDEGAKGQRPYALAREEANEIDRAWPKGVPQDGARGGRDLRLHVAGDVLTAGAAKLLAAAVKRWWTRGGGAVWTYTHSWREIPRVAWDAISVFASVETLEQLHEAIDLNYSVAIVVPEFPNGDRAFDVGRGFKAIPCPAETRGVTCVECRLCLDRDLLSLGRVIAFKAHGNGVLRALAAISEAA